MWFETLVGFREHDVQDVAAQFVVDGVHLRSLANGRVMRHGSFETPSLAELRQRVTNSAVEGSATSDREPAIRVREVIADAAALHRDPHHAGALFQVASQFNTLEMVSPSVTPEQGIDRYENDRTQGPACAVACGAGTIYRNYLVPLGDGIGQRSDRQVNSLGDLAVALGTEVNMRNGYALPTAQQLAIANAAISVVDVSERNNLLGYLRVGLQHDTEVTTSAATEAGRPGHTVSQAYCSALPIAYGEHRIDQWEPLARLVLDAAYEATLAAGAMNRRAANNRRVYLTLLGGGVFGNPTAWILNAIERALGIYAHVDLDVVLVSYGKANTELQPLLSQWSRSSKNNQ